MFSLGLLMFSVMLISSLDKTLSLYEVNGGGRMLWISLISVAGEESFD